MAGDEEQASARAGCVCGRIDDCLRSCCMHSVWGWYTFKPSDFSHSRFISLLPFFLLRTAIFCFVAATCIYGVVEYYSSVPRGAIDHFMFFTNLSYITEAAYFAYALSVSLYHLINPIKSDTPADTSAYNKFWYVVYELITSNSLIVTTVYWALLWSPGRSVSHYSYFAHAVNTPLMLLEVALCRLRRTPLHVFLHLFAILGYMFMTWIFYSQTALWVYSFLNWSSALAPAYYIGLLLFFVLVYYLWLGVEALRDAIAFKLQPLANTLPPAPDPHVAGAELKPLGTVGRSGAGGAADGGGAGASSSTVPPATLASS